MFHTVIAVDPGRVTGWAIAVDQKARAWGQGSVEEAADAILGEVKGMPAALDAAPPALGARGRSPVVCGAPAR